MQQVINKKLKHFFLIRQNLIFKICPLLMYIGFIKRF
jgi:hypothetical protein